MQIESKGGVKLEEKQLTSNPQPDLILCLECLTILLIGVSRLQIRGGSAEPFR